ncbi:beta-lactamase [Sideroxydans lithotrophicus ES-1]|uniref:Beta-lactamase n=2 Tax=Sideroxydans TaxID=314343 RepID=D5CNT0_SIDLE|nr:beta-lactamase [Sideroxydans lithotrophicus ES-1]
MLLHRIVISLFLTVLGACSTPPQKPIAMVRGDYTYTEQYITWLIQQRMSSDDVTGLSIALVDDQRVVWAQGFGYADKQAGIKATPDTVYHLGSIAKVFTATATMQLAEQGKLDIDQPLQKILPEFSIKSRFGGVGGITPRNIMDHHSGLPGNWVRGMSERHPKPFTDLVTAVKNEYMAFPPNYVFAYSNLGVTLLGAAIGNVSGVSYASYMHDHLLQPLGMNHSEFAPRIPGKSYNKGKEVEAIPLRDLPSGGLNSSVDDMTHFMQMIFADGRYDGKQIVQPESLREMFKVQNANVPLDFDFKMGLGWMLSGVDVPHAGTVASHGGTTLNYHTMVAILPEHKLGVVVMSNSTTSQTLVADVTAEMLKLALEAKRGIDQPERKVVEMKSVPLDEEDIRAYSGYFETLIGLVKVEGASGELTADLMGWKFQLVKHDDGRFGVRLKLLGFIPVANSQMKEMSMSLHHIDGHEVLALDRNGEAMLIGEKLQPKPLPEYLNEYVGKYDIVNKHDGPMPENIRVLREGDLLVGEFTFAEKPGFLFRTAFLPVAQDELVMAGLGSGKGDTVRLAKIGGEEHIYYSGFDLKKRPAARSQ